MIRAIDLSYAYPGGELLRFPPVALEPGQSLVLRGNSGSGKSTWLALVAGLLTASQGELCVAGQDLSALSASARDGWRARTIGFLPQKLHLSAALTVAENLALVHFAAGVPTDRAAIGRSLAALGVADLAHRRPSQLSGGQAQRVALARAVLLQPKVILADEPTASLDDAATAAALGLLTSTAVELGATLVIATHDARVTQALPSSIQCFIGSIGNTSKIL
jgi:putative ABC transport system ATP-binding protein